MPPYHDLPNYMGSGLAYATTVNSPEDWAVAKLMRDVDRASLNYGMHVTEYYPVSFWMSMKCA